MTEQSDPPQSSGAAPSTETLHITLNYARGQIELHWTVLQESVAVYVRCTGYEELTWQRKEARKIVSSQSSCHRNAVRARLRRLQEEFRMPAENISASALRRDPKKRSGTMTAHVNAWGAGESPWAWLEEEIQVMVENVRDFFRVDSIAEKDAESRFPAELSLSSQRAQDEVLRLRQNQQWLREQQEQRERRRQLRAAMDAAQKPAPKPPTAPPPVPEAPVRWEPLKLEVQQTLLPRSDLRDYFLRERAALWWVSNQTDDLLALPSCRIQRLEYQIRTALRVIGPLRGRALLSDEVGLGKTIEAGLVLKEYLTRGMVKRFLVLTVPSLVDQWADELAEKFGLATVSTNMPAARNDPEEFWRGNSGIVASLHTLKQPGRLAVAQAINWDMLIVDEAHYLRNRASQAWQAVNALPRQFLLLLTATPVQNSLDELYNLVTLLQPGQLPSPKEFRARFVDPQKPHQPKEPDELRRLLGQVMIRNTRANTGLNLPPRRAETVLFQPTEEESRFWQAWDVELRLALAKLNASQSSLWGRLLLQAAGSSPAAWRDALESFPDRAAAKSWRQQAPLEGGWKQKCQALLPLTKSRGGVVVFTQFLHTQAAIRDELQAAAVPVFVIHGKTPPAERQPITEAFHHNGGALLLTHSGTEGRNLQFSHQLVNFDLPWNPMEIEQRIGRLHRLGQQHVVRIYNLVQSGSLQQHLLDILQEKLNLFELVVGETGLILGDRFTSDEFAEEVLRRWRESDGRVAEAMQSLGDALAAARQQYGQVKELDETLFASDYESL